MADFRKGQGAGNWDAANTALTIKVNEIAEFVLWGNGRTGELLVLAVTPGEIVEFVSEVTSPVAGERLFRLKFKSPGVVTVKALGADKNEFAKALRIVALPAKESSGAPDHIVWFAGKGDDDEDVAIEGYKKAEAVGGTALHLKSFDRFTRLLTQYRDDGRKIAKMEFNTHGSPGQIRPRDLPRINKAAIQGLRGTGLNNVFTPGARIFFHGCNVAEGEAGVAFLKEVGSVLLAGGGGSVGASTSVGFSLGWIGNGKVYHAWGDLVVAFFDTTGRVTEVIRQ